MPIAKLVECSKFKKVGRLAKLVECSKFKNAGRFFSYLGFHVNLGVLSLSFLFDPPLFSNKLVSKPIFWFAMFSPNNGVYEVQSSSVGSQHQVFSMVGQVVSYFNIDGFGRGVVRFGQNVGFLDRREKKDNKGMNQIHLHLSNDISQDILKEKNIAALWLKLEQLHMMKEPVQQIATQTTLLSSFIRRYTSN